MTGDNKSGPLRVTFLSPGPSTEPCGGPKVVYEYANFLVRRGHTVQFVLPNMLHVDKPLSSFGPRTIVSLLFRYVALKITRKYDARHWFPIDPEVRMNWVHSLDAKYVPDADVVIATAWETAEWALTYPASKGRRFYLIQHLETWSGPEERVMNTWRAPLEKIVVAGWLQRIATGLGQTSHLIHNGMDFTRFKLTVPPEERDPHRILMLFHYIEWKGSADGLAAFAIARQTIPELRLTLFGISPRPRELSAGITYHQQPSQTLLNQLYNEAAVFISPSWTEGWGLPPAEALACGAAIAVTTGGADEAFAIHEETALVSPIKDPAALAANIVRLVRDRELRLRLARNGNALVQQFTWQHAGEELEALITAPAAPRSSNSEARDERVATPV